MSPSSLQRVSSLRAGPLSPCLAVRCQVPGTQDVLHKALSSWLARSWGLSLFRCCKAKKEGPRCRMTEETGNSLEVMSLVLWSFKRLELRKWEQEWLRVPGLSKLSLVLESKKVLVWVTSRLQDTLDATHFTTHSPRLSNWPWRIFTFLYVRGQGYDWLEKKPFKPSQSSWQSIRPLRG